MPLISCNAEARGSRHNPWREGDHWKNTPGRQRHLRDPRILRTWPPTAPLLCNAPDPPPATKRTPSLRGVPRQALRWRTGRGRRGVALRSHYISAARPQPHAANDQSTHGAPTTCSGLGSMPPRVGALVQARGPTKHVPRDLGSTAPRVQGRARHRNQLPRKTVPLLTLCTLGTLPPHIATLPPKGRTTRLSQCTRRPPHGTATGFAPFACRVWITLPDTVVSTQ